MLISVVPTGRLIADEATPEAVLTPLTVMVAEPLVVVTVTWIELVPELTVVE